MGKSRRRGAVPSSSSSARRPTASISARILSYSKVADEGAGLRGESARALLDVPIVWTHCAMVRFAVWSACCRSSLLLAPRLLVREPRLSEWVRWMGRAGEGDQDSSTSPTRRLYCSSDAASHGPARQLQRRSDVHRDEGSPCCSCASALRHVSSISSAVRASSLAWTACLCYGEARGSAALPHRRSAEAPEDVPVAPPWGPSSSTPRSPALPTRSPLLPAVTTLLVAST